jgi:hypothetical protein
MAEAADEGEEEGGDQLAVVGEGDRDDRRGEAEQPLHAHHAVAEVLDRARGEHEAGQACDDACAPQAGQCPGEHAPQCGEHARGEDDAEEAERCRGSGEELGVEPEDEADQDDRVFVVEVEQLADVEVSVRVGDETEHDPVVGVVELGGADHFGDREQDRQRGQRPQAPERHPCA